MGRKSEHVGAPGPSGGMTSGARSRERLDHLPIIARVCRERGGPACLEEHGPTHRPQVRGGTATRALILHGRGFSHRQRSLVPQGVARKPVEQVLGKGISAKMLTDDGFGQAVDWLNAHDPAPLFAEMAPGARPVVGVLAHRSPWIPHPSPSVETPPRSDYRPHIWLFTRPPRGSHAVDGDPGHDP
jgi:hypothetical protein